MEILTVPVQHIHALLHRAEARGLRKQDLLDGSGITGELLESQAAHITSQAYIGLASRIMEALSDESCGLLPTPVKPGSFVLLCQCCISCETLGQFLGRMIKFFRMINQDVDPRVITSGEKTVYEIGVPAEASPSSQHVMVILLGLAHRLASWAIRQHIPLDYVHIRGPRHERAQDYDFLFSRRVMYEQTDNAICFPSRFMTMNIQQDVESLQSFQQAPALHLINNSFVNPSLTYQIRTLLRQSEQGHFPGFQSLAEYFHLSPATLRRRLQDEDTGYQRIKDSVRRDLAIWSLGRDKSIEKAAAKAGFSDTTAFFRAFKRWTGTTPKAYIPPTI